jgi:hypothetical protein
MTKWVRVVSSVDAVYVDMDERTAFCSGGVTRFIFEMYDCTACLTEDPDESIAGVMKVGEHQFVLLDFTEAQASHRQLMRPAELQYLFLEDPAPRCCNC